MRASGRTVRDVVFASAMLAALGLGTAAAAARPARAEAPPTCDPVRCNQVCEARHGPFAHGECWGDDCVCAI
jgi:hypothetical protein